MVKSKMLLSEMDNEQSFQYCFNLSLTSSTGGMLVSKCEIAFTWLLEGDVRLEGTGRPRSNEISGIGSVVGRSSPSEHDEHEDEEDWQ